MNEKIDDVAKAIRDECHRRGYLVSIPATDALWPSMARVGIASMRDPTCDMIDEMADFLVALVSQEREAKVALEIYQAGIDEALK